MSKDFEEIRKSICSEYDFEEIGIGEYLVHTDMYYDDGDELHIVLKRTEEGYILTDEGHTMMWLSYDEYNFTDNRMKLLDGIIQQNSVSLENERISVFVDQPSKIGPALSSLMQAMMSVSNLRYLSRNNVASTFLEDIRTAFRDSELGDRCEYGKKISTSSGNSIEPDIYIGLDRPVLIFGAYNSERAKEVFINLLLAKDLDQGYRTVVVIDNDASISQKDQERLVNTANRPIIGTEHVVEVTKEFIEA